VGRQHQRAKLTLPILLRYRPLRSTRHQLLLSNLSPLFHLPDKRPTENIFYAPAFLGLFVIEQLAKPTSERRAKDGEVGEGDGLVE